MHCGSRGLSQHSLYYRKEKPTVCVRYSTKSLQSWSRTGRLFIPSSGFFKCLSSIYLAFLLFHFAFAIVKSSKRSRPVRWKAALLCGWLHQFLTPDGMSENSLGIWQEKIQRVCRSPVSQHFGEKSNRKLLLSAFGWPFKGTGKRLQSISSLISSVVGWTIPHGETDSGMHFS